MLVFLIFYFFSLPPNNLVKYKIGLRNERNFYKFLAAVGLLGYRCGCCIWKSDINPLFSLIHFFPYFVVVVLCWCRFICRCVMCYLLNLVTQIIFFMIFQHFEWDSLLFSPFFRCFYIFLHKIFFKPFLRQFIYFSVGYSVILVNTLSKSWTVLLGNGIVAELWQTLACGSYDKQSEAHG